MGADPGVIVGICLERSPDLVVGLYVGYDNGCWLQVRRLDALDPTERAKLEAPPGAFRDDALPERVSDVAVSDHTPGSAAP